MARFCAAVLSLSFNHVHHVRGSTNTDLTAVNTNDRVAFLQIHFCLFLEKFVDVSSYGLVVSHWIRCIQARNNFWKQTTLEAALTSNLFIRGYDNNRSSWMILGNAAGGSASVTESDYEFAFEIKRCLNSRRANALLNG